MLYTHKILAALTLVVLFNQCNMPDKDEIDFINPEQEIAVPLVNTKLSVKELADKISGNASVDIDTDGRVTAVYSGDLIGFTSTSIFPPIPGIIDNVLPDTLSDLLLPINVGHTIKKAEFKKTNMSFKFRSTTAKKYKLKITIPYVTKDGNIWSNVYDADFTNGNIEVKTPNFLLDGWTVIPNQNLVRFIYNATDEDGNRVKLDYAAMVVDVLEFSNVEGYFGSKPFDIPGDFIDINLFDTWISGGLEIDDPQIVLEVQNAFGFPVRSKVNKLEFHTKSGNIFPLESQYITDGINFEYPTVDQQGQTKTTYFTFDKSNSNIKQIFNDKIVKVVYDIDALPNPDFDTNVTNFLNDQSFFKVNVDVKIPMLLKANNFIIGDTVDVDLSNISNVNKAIFKSIMGNNFPVDIKFQGYFLDGNNKLIDSLFNEAAISLIGPELDAKGKTIGSSVETKFKELNGENFDKIKSSKKFVLTAGFNNASNQNLRWVYDNYSLDLKLGAIINIKE